MPDHVAAGCAIGLYEGEEGLGRAAVAADHLKRRSAPRLVYAHESAAATERLAPRDERDDIHVWEGAGHFLHQERPAEFNHLMLEWIRRL